jgi:hypothetical protein
MKIAVTERATAAETFPFNTSIPSPRWRGNRFLILVGPGVFLFSAVAAPFLPSDFRLGRFTILSVLSHLATADALKRAPLLLQLIWLTTFCSAVVFVVLP